MIIAWAIFIIFVLGMLALDLGVFHRKAEVMDTRQALLWSGLCVLLSVLFSGIVYLLFQHHWWGFGMQTGDPDGLEAAVLYLTGYVIELSLSMDNLFVIALIFASFQIPAAQQHRLLFWGILGALIMRGVMIGAGAVLIAKFHWILYVFGAILLFSSWRMLTGDQDSEDKENRIVLWFRQHFRVAEDVVDRFVIRRDGRLMVTQLLLTLVVIEISDVVFAVDSIPAIFSITEDPFLVFTSNIFAILGLRSLYFVLADAVARFHYLKYSLSLLLAMVGMKLLLKDWLHHVPGMTYYTLAAVVVVLTVGIAASIRRSKMIEANSRGATASDNDLILSQGK